MSELEHNRRVNERASRDQMRRVRLTVRPPHLAGYSLNISGSESAWFQLLVVQLEPASESTWFQLLVVLVEPGLKALGFSA